MVGKESPASRKTLQRERRRVQVVKEPQKSLKEWTKQKWQTKSGKKSSETGERYLPRAAIKALNQSEYAATTAAKRRDKAKGKQFSKQPKKIADKVRKYR